MLNSAEEQEIGDSPYQFEGGDDEIVAAIQKEFEVKAGNVMEVDESDDKEGAKASSPQSRLWRCVNRWRASDKAWLIWRLS